MSTVPGDQLLWLTQIFNNFYPLLVCVCVLMLLISLSKTVIGFAHLFSLETLECLYQCHELGMAVLFTVGTALAALLCCLNVGLLMVISPLTDRTE